MFIKVCIYELISEKISGFGLLKTVLHYKTMSISTFGE